jgi:hypothetical protein
MWVYCCSHYGLTINVTSAAMKCIQDWAACLCDLTNINWAACPYYERAELLCSLAGCQLRSVSGVLPASDLAQACTLQTTQEFCLCNNLQLPCAPRQEVRATQQEPLIGHSCHATHSGTTCRLKPVSCLLRCMHSHNGANLCPWQGGTFEFNNSVVGSRKSCAAQKQLQANDVC